MLHYTAKNTTEQEKRSIPTEGFELSRKKKSKPQQSNDTIITFKPDYYIITKNGDYLVKPHIMRVITDMIAHSLQMISVCTADPYPFRHSATFLMGTKWREKPCSLWRELDPGGTFRVLLRPPR